MLTAAQIAAVFAARRLELRVGDTKPRTLSMKGSQHRRKVDSRAHNDHAQWHNTSPTIRHQSVLRIIRNTRQDSEVRPGLICVHNLYNSYKHSEKTRIRLSYRFYHRIYISFHFIHHFILFQGLSYSRPLVMNSTSK